MIEFFRNFFVLKKEIFYIEGDCMKKFLIVGLGNIGFKYENMRYNIGFKIVDFLVCENEFIWEIVKLGDIIVYKKKGRSFLLLKFSIYMNFSGKVVKYWLEKENILLENLLVVIDDFNLEFGMFCVKIKGSDGGYNGLKDI